MNRLDQQAADEQFKAGMTTLRQRPGLCSTLYTNQKARNRNGVLVRTGAIVRVDKDRRTVKERKRSRRLEREQKVAA